MKLTQASVKALAPRETRYVVFDDAMAGLGVRVEASGTKSYILEYRPAGGGRGASKRRIVIGRAGPGGITCDDARTAARRLLADVAHGKDPAQERSAAKREGALKEIADRWMDERVKPKRAARTATEYQAILDRHILPAWGKKKLRELTRPDVSKVHGSISKTAPTMANRVLAVVSSMWGWSAREGLCAMADNPAQLIERNREEGCERFLTPEELQRLGATLREAETVGLPWPEDESKPRKKHSRRSENRRTMIDARIVAAVRFLLLTGCRVSEVLRLRWADIDFGRGLLLLPVSKTGRRAVVLSGAALEILEAQPREVGSEYVFPGRDGGARADIKRPWAAICAHAGLDGLRIHDLRHSAASFAAGAGMSLPVIGALLGHSQPATTARYAHLANDPVRAAADAIADHIEEAMARNAVPFKGRGR